MHGSGFSLPRRCITFEYDLVFALRRSTSGRSRCFGLVRRMFAAWQARQYLCGRRSFGPPHALHVVFLMA
jgi:hypothetical protein